MKISKDTLHLLKSFASINPVMYLGDKEAVRVISPSKDIIGIFQAQEVLDHDCVFWDWPTLLSTIDSMGGENAELDFQDKFVKITSEDKSSIKYFYTPEIIVAQSNQKPKAFAAYAKPMEFDFNFDIPSDVLAKVMKISRIMNLSKIEMEIKDGSGNLNIVDDSGKVNHSFTQTITGEGTGKISLYISTLNIVGGTYHVEVKNSLFAKFVNKDIPLFYIIAAKKES